MNSKEMWGRVKAFLDEAGRYVDKHQLSVGLGAAGAGALGARAVTGKWKYAPHGAAIGWFGTRSLAEFAPKSAPKRDWQFTRKGLYVVPRKGESEDDATLRALREAFQPMEGETIIDAINRAAGK